MEFSCLDKSSDGNNRYRYIICYIYIQCYNVWKHTRQFIHCVESQHKIYIWSPLDGISITHDDKLTWFVMIPRKEVNILHLFKIKLYCQFIRSMPFDTLAPTFLIKISRYWLYIKFYSPHLPLLLPLCNLKQGEN